MEAIRSILAGIGVFMLGSLILGCTAGSCKIGFNDRVLYERVAAPTPHGDEVGQPANKERER